MFEGVESGSGWSEARIFGCLSESNTIKRQVTYILIQNMIVPWEEFGRSKAMGRTWSVTSLERIVPNIDLAWLIILSETGLVNSYEAIDENGNTYLA
jgi:hypothetical protein